MELNPGYVGETREWTRPTNGRRVPEGSSWQAPRAALVPHSAESGDAGFRSAADEIADLFAGQRGEVAEALHDSDACGRLWLAVIRRALDDLAFLRRAEAGHGATNHQLLKITRIQENSPVEFLDSPWFREICDYLGIDPDLVRETYKLDVLSAA